MEKKLLDWREFSDRCELLVLEDGSPYCEWNYNGLGFQYQLLAGPAFIAVYSIVGIGFGMAADKFNRWTKIYIV